jgi:hypothetical protein
VTASTDRAPGAPPRLTDLIRHLDDLRTRSYEGVRERGGRDDVFRRAVELLGPVVTAALDQADRDFLAGTGERRFVAPASDGAGGLVARWELSWPEQRVAANKRADAPVGPVQVIASFPASFNHGHLSGSKAGNWPLQVLDEVDAERQALVVGAIVEAELHERLFEAGWQVMPGYARAHQEA